jgi:hypothetical protein
MNGHRGVFKNAIEVVLGIEVALLFWHLLRLLFVLVLLVLLIHFTIGFPLAMEYVDTALTQARGFLSGFKGGV